MLKHVSKFTKINVLDTIKKYSEETSQVVLITGFITPDGFEIIKNKIKIENIKRIIVGVFTEKAEKIFSQIEEEHPHIELFVFSFVQKENKNSNYYFTPILHAKIIAGYKSRKISWAYTGSANITSFALKDENIESGVFIKEKNKELEVINETIKKISNKKNLIDYKLNKNIVLTPEEKFKIKPGYLPTSTIQETVLIILDEALDDRIHQGIYIYCNLNVELLSLNTSNKILFYFIKDKKLILNKVRLVGDVFSTPDIPISFYIENLDNTGYKTRQVYISPNNADCFITLENIKLDSSTEKAIKNLANLLNTDTSILSKGHVELKDHSFLKKIIFEQKPSKIKLESENYLKSHDIVDLSKLEIEQGEIITLNDLFHSNDKILFNKLFSLERRIIKD
jgi:hypothetical protein